MKKAEHAVAGHASQARQSCTATFDQKMKSLIICALLAWAGAASGAGIQLTIEPVTNTLHVTDASARLIQSAPEGVLLTDTFPHPDTGYPTKVTANNIVRLPKDASPLAEAWVRTNAFRVDFFACIKNTSTNSLNFYDEWNSEGYDRLKIVCYTFRSFREIWIVKQPGVWYRNFPSWTPLLPGATLRIPVAFDPALWDGVAKVKQAGYMAGIRIFYNQLDTPTNRFGISSEHWQGCEFSPHYDIGIVLPRRGLKTIRRPQTEQRSNRLLAD